MRCADQEMDPELSEKSDPEIIYSDLTHCFSSLDTDPFRIQQNFLPFVIRIHNYLIIRIQIWILNYLESMIQIGILIYL